MNDVKITVIKGTFLERFFQTVSFDVLLVVTIYGAAKGGTLAQLALGGSLLPMIFAAFWKMARFRLHRWTGKAFKIPASSGYPPEYAFIAEKIRFSRWLPFSCLLKAFIFRMVIAESISGSTTVVDRTVGEFKQLEGLIKPIGGRDMLEGDAAVNFSDRLKELEGECSVERGGMLEMLNSGLIIKPEQPAELATCTVAELSSEGFIPNDLKPLYKSIEKVTEGFTIHAELFKAILDLQNEIKAIESGNLYIKSDIINELTGKYTKLLEQINELSRRYTKFEKSRPTKVSTARDQIRAEVSGEIDEMKEGISKMKEQLEEIIGQPAEDTDIESTSARVAAGKEGSDD